MNESRGGSRAALISKIERCVIIVNGSAVNYYHKALYLGYCSIPRSASGKSLVMILNPFIKFDRFEALNS